MSVSLEHYLVLSAILFIIGIYGALVKRNAIVILMCIEIMLNAVNIALVAFARYLNPEDLDMAATGQIFVIFIMVVAAAEAAVGLAIIAAIYRSRRTVDAAEIDLMKG